MDGLLYGIVIALIVFYALFGICMFRNGKKQSDEDKNKMDGDLLGGDYLSEGDMAAFNSERPFVLRSESFN